MEIIVPSLFFLEIVNVFLTKSLFNIQDVLTIEEALGKMNLVVAFPDHLTLKNAINIATKMTLQSTTQYISRKQLRMTQCC